jgi:hypothetical protein
MEEGTAMTEPTAPEWLLPGAEVIVWHNYASRDIVEVVTSKIETVGKRYFSVAGRPERFSIRTLSHGGRDYGITRHVLPKDSDEGRRILKRAAQLRTVRYAEGKVKEWLRLPTPSSRKAAIAALQAVDDDPETL